MGDKLGDMLLQSSIITRQQLDSALDYQKAIGGKLGVILVKLNFVREDRLTDFLSRQMKLPIVHLKDHRPDPSALCLVPKAFAEKHELLPLSHEGDTLTVVTADPTDYPAIDELAFTSGTKVQTVLATRTEVSRAIQAFYGSHPVEHVPAGPRAGAHPAPPPAAHPNEAARKRGRAAATVGAATIETRDALPPNPLDISADKLVRALAGVLIEHKVISLAELMEHVAKTGQGDRR